MKLLETIKLLFAKLSDYITAAKDIEKKISETLKGKAEEVEEDDEEDEEEEEEKPKAVKAKKKPAKKKKKYESK